jgi:heptosyltransferase-2
MKVLPPIMRRYADTLTKVGIDTVKIDKDLFRTEIFTDDPSKERVKIILEKKKVPEEKRLICIVPSSKHFTKTYPADYYIELMKKFDNEKYCIVMIGKGEDNKRIEEIQTVTNSNVINLCDELNLLELAELMKRTALVISGDTGPMHIAETMQIPLVMIAGSSVREFGFYPQSEKAEVLENTGLTCRPCSHIGRDKCPKGHFKCMKDITPEMVFEKCKKLMYQS